MSFLIRVQLPDTPGSLGELAEAIGAVDGNIQSVDIVENTPDGTVTDDIVVELPVETLADALITACGTVKGVEVDSIRPFSGRVDRRGQIQLLASIARKAHNVTAAMEQLVQAMPQALTSGWAIVADTKGDIKRVAGSSAAPEDDGTVPADLQVSAARQLNPETEDWIPASWALLDSSIAATPLGSTGLVLIIGRVGGPDYLASEVDHLGNLGTILGALLHNK
ncbi:amino acid-binding ACT domain protein [Corynebacterium sp. L4756]|uniref:amino acid-binding ACT domain protein n=1 Tax=unclassified Corynebacterium TaxID=2624378 RepID=UPI00374CE218